MDVINMIREYNDKSKTDIEKYQMSVKNVFWLWNKKNKNTFGKCYVKYAFLKNNKNIFIHKKIQKLQ